MSNANIVFDGNTHENINPCGSCYEGRLQVLGEGPGPTGVTIQNSRFGPGGNADGMQLGAVGVQVLGNEFVGIRQVSATSTPTRCSSTAPTTRVISGNYFHDMTVAIMAPDGGTDKPIIDNVFVGSGEYRPAVQMGSQRNTTFVHNTVLDIDVFVDRKAESSTSSTGVIRDNLMVRGRIEAPASKCSGCTVDNNFFSRRQRHHGTSARCRRAGLHGRGGAEELRRLRAGRRLARQGPRDGRHRRGRARHPRIGPAPGGGRPGGPGRRRPQARLHAARSRAAASSSSCRAPSAGGSSRRASGSGSAPARARA